MKGLLISPKTIQEYLVSQGQDIEVDGIIGKRSTTAIAHVLTVAGLPASRWSVSRRLVAIQQVIMQKAGADPGACDGFVGPNTRHAVEAWQNIMRDVPGSAAAPGIVSPWPREAEVPEFYGAAGAHLVRVKFPYKMRLAWNPAETVTSGMFHEKVADSLVTVLKRVLVSYKMPRVETLGLSTYSGGYAPRLKRGGHTYSMHAYGIALDFDDTHNQMRWGSDRARFAKPEYDIWWKIWEEAGWVSLGRERNYDWMHVQAARL